MSKDNIPNDFNDTDLDGLISYFSSDDKPPKEKSTFSVDPEAIKSKSVLKNNADKKNFVIHIDEDNDIGFENPDKTKNNDSAIYFSNYQHGSRKRDFENLKNKTNNAKNAKNNTNSSGKKKPIHKTVGGRAAIIMFAAIIVFTSFFSYMSISAINDMLAINTSDDVVSVKIPDDSSYNDIINILSKNKLIKRKSFCKLFTTFRKYNKDKYMSGVYYLNSSMGVEGMLNELKAAPATADTVTLSFPEGFTISQIFEKLEKYDVCTSAKLYAALDEIDYEFSFERNISNNEKRYQWLEGYMFPDTYEFYVGEDPNSVIKKFLSNFNNKWTQTYSKRAKKLGYSMDQIMTIASIIQKEAADSSQMSVVSSVLHNRLSNSVNYPTLDCDSTSLYITNYVTPLVGETKGAYYLNNYNTSAIKGLPSGPICNPGIDAVEAALYWEDTDYYYFLHDKSGKIYLASTNKGHESNYVLAIKANKENEK